ncbi:hypothetical protein AFE_2290 [Acidithiobacillus ferrooxidans ATCC 23270]|uniref:Uncharacterized protein n=1 Tax=Acidithiobacillus ferrooxidans (strain ATCC 23270 / DSM 14882 / CIP 104768 / NCIMB 8455) TaxID=243159 RepID=B7J662_ACIF2|nr:hypothetical protein AFE_2290 [Acidithiobacillus ferrooxidans ATCC 23270]
MLPAIQRQPAILMPISTIDDTDLEQPARLMVTMQAQVAIGMITFGYLQSGRTPATQLKEIGHYSHAPPERCQK